VSINSPYVKKKKVKPEEGLTRREGRERESQIKSTKNENQVL